MKSNNKSAIVGGFILGALALGTIAILFFGTTNMFNKLPTMVVFFHESVAGLEIGAPVTFHGVTIGSVKSISLEISSKDMAANIPVLLDINPNKVVWENQKLQNEEDFQRLVKAGFCAQLAVQSLVTGQLRIDLDFHPDVQSQTVGLMPGKSEIPTIPSDLDQIKNKLSELPIRELAVTAQQTLASIDKLSKHLDTELTPLIQSMQKTADSATQTLNTTNSVIHGLQTNVDPLLVSIRELSEPHAPFRSNLEATARDMAASASSLRNFSHSLERDPSVLLTGRQNP